MWGVLCGDAESADVREVMAKLAIRLKGYGEPQVRFAVGMMDPDGASGVDEVGLWAVITSCSPKAVQGPLLTHFRRLWRSSETWLPPMPEEGDEADAEAMAKAKAAVEEAKKLPRRVVADAFLTALGEDEFAAASILPEIEVPKEEKKEGEEDEEADD